MIIFDEEMEKFTESACLHDFKVLLLENYAGEVLKNTKRYIVDSDLCEFWHDYTISLW